MKKSDSQHEKTISIEPSVNEVMAGENDPSTQEQIGNVTDEDGLMELFDQFSGLTSSVSDRLEPDTTNVIVDTSLQG